MGSTIHENDDDVDNDNQVQTEEEVVEVPEEKKEAVKAEDNVEVVDTTEEGDERTAQGNDDEADDSEEGSQKERKRETAAQRRARAKQAKERDKKELEFQRKLIADQDRKIADLQRGQIVSRVTELDNRIATAQNDVETFDKIKAAAITKANGADVVAADRLRNEAATKLWQAQNEREQLVRTANTPQPKPVPYLDKAQKFFADNAWYNHDRPDADSLIVKDIDAEVAKEYVPTSDKYWQELQRRVEKHFPEKYGRRQQQNDDEGEVDEEEQEDVREQPRRKGPPVGGAGHSNSATKTQVRLSPQRVQALKDAGLWDDPKTRMRMAKQYANYDRNNRTG